MPIQSVQVTILRNMGNLLSIYLSRCSRAVAGKYRSRALLCLLCAFSSASLVAMEQQEPLVLGVFPRRSVQATTEIFTPLVKYLSRKLNREVRLETTHDFASFWDMVEHKRYDIVHFNQYHYLRSHKELGYQVIAQNEEFGQSKIAGAIVVRTDSGINSLQDLRGKKIVFGGDRLAMQAYIAASYLLRQAGLKPGDYFEQFALNPPKAAIATFYQQAVAAGTGDHVLQLPRVKGEIDIDKMKYLAIGQPLAHLPWAVKAELPSKVTQDIASLLIGLNQQLEGKEILKQLQLTNILPANDSDYNDHRHIIKTVLNEEL